MHLPVVQIHRCENISHVYRGMQNYGNTYQTENAYLIFPEIPQLHQNIVQRSVKIRLCHFFELLGKHELQTITPGEIGRRGDRSNSPLSQNCYN